MFKKYLIRAGLRVCSQSHIMSAKNGGWGSRLTFPPSLWSEKSEISQPLLPPSQKSHFVEFKLTIKKTFLKESMNLKKKKACVKHDKERNITVKKNPACGRH